MWLKNAFIAHEKTTKEHVILFNLLSCDCDVWINADTQGWEREFEDTIEAKKREGMLSVLFFFCLDTLLLLFISKIKLKECSLVPGDHLLLPSSFWPGPATSHMAPVRWPWSKPGRTHNERHESETKLTTMTAAITVCTAEYWCVMWRKSQICEVRCLDVSRYHKTKTSYNLWLKLCYSNTKIFKKMQSSIWGFFHNLEAVLMSWKCQ